MLLPLWGRHVFGDGLSVAAASAACLLIVVLHVWGTFGLDLPHAVLNVLFCLCDSAQPLCICITSAVDVVSSA